jgi:LPXTG-motif cell wall-anchored protein
MRSRSHRIACLLAALSLASPAAALGQSAGDEQYEDPFAPEPGQSDDGGSAGDDSGQEPAAGGTAEPAPEPAPAAAEPAATTAQAPDGGGELPRTGADTGWLALSGMVLLGGGIALRVRLSEPARRRR